MTERKWDTHTRGNIRMEQGWAHLSTVNTLTNTNRSSDNGTLDSSHSWVARTKKTTKKNIKWDTRRIFWCGGVFKGGLWEWGSDKHRSIKRGEVGHKWRQWGLSEDRQGRLEGQTSPISASGLSVHSDSSLVCRLSQFYYDLRHPLPSLSPEHTRHINDNGE